jgi:hypothetical protein
MNLEASATKKRRGQTVMMLPFGTQHRSMIDEVRFQAEA